MTMTDTSIDDITQQARQGSVAAIIQILNDRLATDGVRTRAVLAQGILQLLCEAETVEHLEQNSLVARIQDILASLRPRHIRRVKINSRLVKEQQLLWLDEIKRDPEGQLLWTEEIVLPRPNPIQILIEDLTSAQHPSDKVVVKTGLSRRSRDRRQFAQGIIGGAGLSVFLLLIGWVAYDWLGNTSPQQQTNLADTANDDNGADDDIESVQSSSVETSPEQLSVDTTSQADPSPSPDNTQSVAETSAIASPDEADPFVEAVMLAQQAVVDGQSASTPAEWLELASRWQRASDLMGEVSPTDERYSTAQDRQAMYKANSEESLKQADLLQGN